MLIRMIKQITTHVVYSIIVICKLVMKIAQTIEIIKY